MKTKEQLKEELKEAYIALAAEYGATSKMYQKFETAMLMAASLPDTDLQGFLNVYHDLHKQRKDEHIILLKVQEIGSRITRIIAELYP